MKSIKENEERLDIIASLEDNWNNNGASKIPQDIINTLKDNLNNFIIQPDIFPTACDSIQFEYEKDNGDYLEFELFGNSVLKIFTMLSDSSETTEKITFDINEINNRIKEFYK